MSEVRYTLGQIAFEEYSSSRKGKDVRGQPIPQWPQLEEAVRTAWEDAAQRVVEVYNSGIYSG